MKLPSASTQMAVTAQLTDEVDTRLHGRWLLLARVGWISIVVPVYALFVAYIPAYFVSLHHLRAPNVQMFTGQLTYADVHMLQAWGLSLDFYATCMVVVSLLFQCGYAIIGVLLFWRKPDERIALFTSFALMMLPFGFANLTLQTLPPSWSWLIPTLSALGNASLLLCGFVFPDGRFVPRWIGWLALAMLGYWAVVALLPSWQLDLSWLSLVLFFGFVVSTVVAQLYRYHRVSTPRQRQQTKLALFGVSIAGAGNILPRLLSSFVLLPLSGGSGLALALQDSLIMGTMLAIPLTLGLAVLRDRLWEIDVIINRTLVYGALSVCVVGIYILIVGSLGTLFEARGNFLISLVATGVVAIIFQPLREWLQRAINKLTYGERDDPYRILSQLGKRLEATLIPDAILPTVVETVAQALKLPYVAIQLKEGEQFRLVATFGVDARPALYIPLLYQQETVGRLLLSTRSPGESFSSADCRLLDDLARQAGIAAHTVRLSADLQRSREHLLLAQEEERRRLARELHDSVSQALYGISLGVHTARMALDRDPSQVAEPLDYVLSLTEAAQAEMRALIFELRPESLETEGLVSALTKQTAALHVRHQLEVSTELCAEPDLPLKVKQELYRIAQEALHNVVKHARASKVNVHLERTDEGNMLEIQDDGVGFDTTATFPGHLGLHSMRERVTNMGGTFEIESVPGTGTRICVRIPACY